MAVNDWSNPLEEYPTLRKVAYNGLWGAGVLFGAIQVTSLDFAWENDVAKVLAYLGTAVGFTAARNVVRRARGQHEAQ